MWLVMHGGTGYGSDLDRACDAAVDILLTRGPDALSVRAIAQELGVTGPALTHRWENKERLWRLLVSRVGERWLQAVAQAVRDEGVPGLVPSTEAQVADAWVWLAVADLGRHDQDLSFRVADTLSEERGILREELESTVGHRLPDPVVDALHATAVGFATACAPAGRRGRPSRRARPGGRRSRRSSSAVEARNRRWRRARRAADA